MSRSRSATRYDPNSQRQWSRVDAEWAPQGHALLAEVGPSSYYAWQVEAGGRPFALARLDTDTGEWQGPVYAPDFVQARTDVLLAERHLAGGPTVPDRLRALVGLPPRPPTRATRGVTPRRTPNSCWTSGPCTMSRAPFSAIKKRLLR